MYVSDTCAELKCSQSTISIMNTVKFTFSKEYAEESAEPIDYFCDYDDEEQQINVYVDDVSDALVKDMNDDELCEHFGLDSEFLLYCNRSDFC